MVTFTPEEFQVGPLDMFAYCRLRGPGIERFSEGVKGRSIFSPTLVLFIRGLQSMFKGGFETHVVCLSHNCTTQLILLHPLEMSLSDS